MFEDFAANRCQGYWTVVGRKIARSFLMQSENMCVKPIVRYYAVDERLVKQECKEITIFEYRLFQDYRCNAIRVRCLLGSILDSSLRTPEHVMMISGISCLDTGVSVV